MSDIIITDDMTENKVEFIKISDLDSKPNFVMGAIIDEGGVMQIVINTADEGRLWATWKRMEKAIEFVLQQQELKRRATQIQAAPADVLEKLRG
jgi:hypothetical protein